MLVLLVLLGLEGLFPRRGPVFGRRRWWGNLGLGVLGVLVVRVSAPFAMLAAAEWGELRGFGLLRWAELSFWPALVSGVVLLDLAVWGQHRLMHRVDWLWRVHRVHHTDPELDVSSGVRFHPVEVFLSLCWKSLCVLLLGVGAWGVVVFEIVLSICSLFTHCNVALPAALDRVVRRVWVTPDMHLVHHSVLRAEHDLNFGTVFSCWDRWFGTYSGGRGEGVRVGLLRPESGRAVGLHWLLAQPWLRSSGVAAGESE